MEATYRLGTGRTSSRLRWPALLLAILVITALLLGLAVGVVVAQSNNEAGEGPRTTSGQPSLDSEPVRVFVATQPDGDVTCSSPVTREVVVRQLSGTELNEITCSKGSGGGMIGIGNF